MTHLLDPEPTEAPPGTPVAAIRLTVDAGLWSAEYVVGWLDFGMSFGPTEPVFLAGAWSAEAARDAAVNGLRTTWPELLDALPITPAVVPPLDVLVTAPGHVWDLTLEVAQ